MNSNDDEFYRRMVTVLRETAGFMTLQSLFIEKFGNRDLYVVGSFRTYRALILCNDAWWKPDTLAVKKAKAEAEIVHDVLRINLCTYPALGQLQRFVQPRYSQIFFLSRPELLQHSIGGASRYYSSFLQS